MKKIIVIFTIILTLLISNAYAGNAQVNSKNQYCNQSTVIKKHLNSKCAKQSKNKCAVKIARRGCCSWHKGVCGCSGGHVVCCDETLSPSCRC